MSDSLVLTAASAIVLAAGVLQGAMGFGFALVAAPLLSIVIEPQMVVPVLFVQTFVTMGLILLHARRHLRVRRMWLLTLAGMVGVPAGTVVLVILNASLLRLLIGSTVTLTAVAMMFGFKKTLRHELVASVPVGFVSGALGASTSLSGPPVVFFYTNQDVDPREFRANVVAYFLMLALAMLPSFIIAGLLNSETVLFSAQLLPAALVGVLGGIALNRWIQGTLFRHITLTLMVVAGIAAIVSAALRL
ncbi:MAG: sulfite exporter TauE/SafE family protein [Chloroflexi bacterium]|nr:sulfite exporter TauE/SafE family protein [Chloroflexota bacterium]